MRRLAVLVAAVVAALTFGAAQASATIYVNCPTDLQTAINDAPAGSTLKISGTCLGQFVIDKDLTLAGAWGRWGKPGATLDGNEMGSVLTIESGATVVIKHLKITGGNATDADGGIFNHGTLTLKHVHVVDNEAPEGAGIQNGDDDVDNDARLTLIASVVRGNTAEDDGGGIDNDFTATLRFSRVVNNTSGDIAGGIESEGTLTLKFSHVINNYAENQGGGIVTGEGGETTLFVSKVVRNQTGGDGGGIMFEEGGTLTLIKTLVYRNTAAGDGGGIFLTGGGAIALTASLVFRNQPNNCVGFSSGGCL